MIAINNPSSYSFSKKKAERLFATLLDFYHLGDKRVSVAIVNAKEMRKINRETRGIDKSTDVLSFLLEKNPTGKGEFWGEIFINTASIRRPQDYLDIFTEKKNPAYLTYFLFVHALLHLVGYNDEDEKERLGMIDLGRSFMNKYYR